MTTLLATGPPCRCVGRSTRCWPRPVRVCERSPRPGLVDGGRPGLWSSTSARPRHGPRRGICPGALLVEPNVLKWRFDPASDARLQVASYDLEMVVLCQEGYTSSLAAAALQDLGIHRPMSPAVSRPGASRCGGPDAHSPPQTLTLRPIYRTQSESLGGIPPIPTGPSHRKGGGVRPRRRSADR